MSNRVYRIILAAVMVMGLFTLNAFADEPQIPEYDKSQFQALPDSSQLVISVGVVADYGTFPLDSRGTVMKGVIEKALKKGAEIIYVFSEKQKNGTNSFGVSGAQRHISAEGFRLVEPTVANLRSAVHNPYNKSLIIVRNNMNLILKSKNEELGDDLISETINSSKPVPIKNLMLDTYADLEGDRAAEGLHKVANSRKVEEKVQAHVGQLMARSNDSDGLYEQLVGAKDSTAERLIKSYIKVVAEKDIPKLRKLMKLHSSDVVRTEAGKALVRLHDDAYVEQMLQAEKSIEVARAVKKEMLLQ